MRFGVNIFNNNQKGRSMVEMLGVLAIIGVLSVGSIAGYTNAMKKYKLNQHAQAINLLLNNLLQAKDTLPKPEAGTTLYYGDMLEKLKLLPDGIVRLSNSSLRDKYFKISVTPYHNRVSGQDFGGLGFSFSNQVNYMVDICRNVVWAAKENAANLWLLETGIEGGYTGYTYGNSYCNDQGKKCLSKINLNDIDELCKVCENDKPCSLYVLWK